MEKTIFRCYGALARPFEQWKVGQRFITKRRTVFENDLTNFIHLSGYVGENLFSDMSRAHSDIAQGGKRLVPAFLTASLADGLIVGSGILEGFAIGLVGVSELKAIAPVFVGDTLFVEFQVTETKPSKSKPDRGVVTTLQQVKNQQNKTVLEYQVSRMLKKSAPSTEHNASL